MNKEVSLKIAKLLKQKGFKDFPCNGYYKIEEFVPISLHNVASPYNYLAPTIADVIMWLYETYDIWIQTPFSHNDIKPFCWVISKTLRNISEEEENKNCWLSGIDNDNTQGYDSPTEAAESAIEYTLNNLI